MGNKLWYSEALMFLVRELSGCEYTTREVMTVSFVTGGIELSSEEGTTQVCPLPVAMYALSLVPLTARYNKGTNDPMDPSEVLKARQIWFADDAAAGGKLKAIRPFWDLCMQHGPAYRYFPKPSKTHLVVKPESRVEAVKSFEDTGIQLSKEGEDLAHKAGQRHLGAAIGSIEYIARYFNEKATTWAAVVSRL